MSNWNLIDAVLAFLGINLSAIGLGILHLPFFRAKQLQQTIGQVQPLNFQSNFQQGIIISVFIKR